MFDQHPLNQIFFFFFLHADKRSSNEVWEGHDHLLLSITTQGNKQSLTSR